MICLSGLSELMQRAIAEKMVFMVSQSGGSPGFYNLHFAQYTQKGNCSAYLTYHEDKGQILQYADGAHPLIAFNDIDSVLKYVRKELGDNE